MVSQHRQTVARTRVRAFSGGARSKGLKMRSHSSGVRPTPLSATSTRSTPDAPACGSTSTLTRTSEPSANLIALVVMFIMICDVWPRSACSAQKHRMC
jgi:hypothetical protein